MDVLVLRLDAPLMSFGGVIVDEMGITRDFPARSMLTGLLGNAMGYFHAETTRLQRLQERLHYAVRCDRPGDHIEDYQTVDLGQESLKEPGWTTHGVIQKRAGGSASIGTHIRHRDYIADAAYTVALTLSPEEEDPHVDQLEAALRKPERPLFLGRKPCLPSSPLLLDRVQIENLVEALRHAPLWRRGDVPTSGLRAWWPEGEIPAPQDSRLLLVTDERDWKNQIHVSRRRLREGRVIPREASCGD